MSLFLQSSACTSRPDFFVHGLGSKQFEACCFLFSWFWNFLRFYVFCLLGITPIEILFNSHREKPQEEEAVAYQVFAVNVCGNDVTCVHEPIYSQG